MKFLALETSPNTPEFHGGNVPWWRVVNSKYQISARGNKNDETRQSDKLLAEGIDLDALNSDQIWFAEQEQEGGSEEGEEILELDI